MSEKQKFRTAIILCGGRGTRLGALSKKIPKTLIKIHNEGILWFIIKILKKNKFSHFILPVGYKGKQIKKFIKKTFNNENIQIFNTGSNTSIASRIHKIKKYIKSDDFLLLNGDAIFNFNLNKIYKNHVKNKTKMTFISFGFTANFGTIGVRKRKVLDFRRNFTFDFVKNRDKKSLKAYVYSGMSIMNKIAFSKNFKNYDNFEKKLYPWIIKNFKCNVETPLGFFHAIDNMKDISVANSPYSEDSKYLQIKRLKKLINSTKN
jgi:glucose-1-phosphate cytidylyltransferase